VSNEQRPAEEVDYRDEVKRIHRVADILITAHSILRDGFGRKGQALEVIILLLSVWLTATVFVDDDTARILSPGWVSPKIWIGLLSIGVSALSVLQLKVNWQERSESHGQAARVYTLVKRQCAYVLAQPGLLTRDTCAPLFREYDLAGQIAVLVPDSQFLRLKQRHLKKVAISKLIDQYPGAAPWLLSLKLTIRDAMRWLPKD
jgi:hypothetical protein